MAALRSETIERALDDIERRVLDEVWIGKRRLGFLRALTLLLLAATALWWLDVAGEASAYGSNRVPIVAVSALGSGAAMSLLALRLRRFRGCCAAACLCGLAAVIGLGALWWLRTGRPDAPLTWLTVADMTVALLAVGWLSVVLTPIERSQPEMRTARTL